MFQLECLDLNARATRLLRRNARELEAAYDMTYMYDERQARRRCSPAVS